MRHSWSFRDLGVGTRFFFLTTLGFDPVSRKWKCKCECGKITFVVGSRLFRGVIKSCGCKQPELIRNYMKLSGKSRTHGKSKTRLYRRWLTMRSRCNNPKTESYQWYGGKGIRVCKRWDDFEKFVFDMGEPPFGYTLERKNNDGPYSPKNCKWVVDKTQALNRRSNVFGVVNGVKMTPLELSKLFGRSLSLIYKNLGNGKIEKFK